MPESVGEAQEVPIAKAFFPDGTFTNPAQKGVDLTQNYEVTSREVVFTNTPAGGHWTIIETRSGGDWIQIKNLAPIVIKPDGTPDLTELQKRIESNLDQAVKKADSQLTSPEAKAHWSTDGDKYKVILENPQKFEVFVQVPGLERLTPEQRAQVRAAANDAIARQAKAWDFKVPSTVRLEPPGPGPGAAPGGTPVGPPPQPVQGPQSASDLPAAPDELWNVAAAREVVAREGAVGTPERGFLSGVDVLFLVYTVGSAVYVYRQAPDGEKIARLEEFGLNTALQVAVAGGASKLAGSAAGVGVAFTLGLASDNGTDPEREENIRKLTAQLFPDARGEDFERREGQVRKALKSTKPRDLADEPVPIVRNFEPAQHVLAMNEKDFVEPPPVGSVTRSGARQLAKTADAIAGARSAAMRSGAAARNLGLRQAALGIAKQRHASKTGAGAGEAAAAKPGPASIGSRGNSANGKGNGSPRPSPSQSPAASASGTRTGGRAPDAAPSGGSFWGNIFRQGAGSASPRPNSSGTGSSSYAGTRPGRGDAWNSAAQPGAAPSQGASQGQAPGGPQDFGSGGGGAGGSGWSGGTGGGGTGASGTSGPSQPSGSGNEGGSSTPSWQNAVSDLANRSSSSQSGTPSYEPGPYMDPGAKAGVPGPPSGQAPTVTVESWGYVVPCSTPISTLQQTF